MEPLAHVIKIHVPNYLMNLPIPNSILGWFKLSIKDWVTLVPFFGFVGGVSYATYRVFKPKGHLNPSIKKDEVKVVDCVNIEDLGDSNAFCRCWRSAKFPYCDGAHGKHNRETGDNVGPLVIGKKK